MIIRDPRLHNKDVDARMGKVASQQLYNEGELIGLLSTGIHP